MERYRTLLRLPLVASWKERGERFRTSRSPFELKKAGEVRGVPTRPPPSSVPQYAPLHRFDTPEDGTLTSTWFLAENMFLDRSNKSTKYETDSCW